MIAHFDVGESLLVFVGLDGHNILGHKLKIIITVICDAATKYLEHMCA